MLTIEEYIAQRKKEDKLNEFEIDLKLQNAKICVDYVFEYFNNYLGTTEADEKTFLHDNKIEKYRKEMRNYEQDVRDWLVKIFNENGRQMNRIIGKLAKEDDLFFLYNTDSEFRNLSYECYSNIIKRYIFIKDQSEMIFLFLKDYHRVESENYFNFHFGVPRISEDINDWIDNTWAKYQVNLIAFAYVWADKFYNDENIWPRTHRIKSKYDWRKYDYNYKQKSNLFNLDLLYRRLPKKPFISGKKQEIEILLMYHWTHSIVGDKEYWEEYINKVLPY